MPHNFIANRWGDLRDSSLLLQGAHNDTRDNNLAQTKSNHLALEETCKAKHEVAWGDLRIVTARPLCKCQKPLRGKLQLFPSKQIGLHWSKAISATFERSSNKSLFSCSKCVKRGSQSRGFVLLLLDSGWSKVPQDVNWRSRGES